MTYVSWASFYEGASDGHYFEVLLPRLMEAVVLADGIRNSEIPTYPAVLIGQSNRRLDSVSDEICAARDAFQLVFILVFIHADTGGRNIEEGIATRSRTYCQQIFELCRWPPARCVALTPRHETEAWILADPDAIKGALGYSGTSASLGLPANAKEAERIVDPKAVLHEAIQSVAGRRRAPRTEQIFPAIAQRQSIEVLRGSESFRTFEVSLRHCLADLGCIGR